MHQEHNIAWNTITANLTYIHEKRDLAPRNRPTQASELNHFVRTVVAAIRTFSDTERAKYPPASQLRSECTSSGKLFPDDLRERHPEFLNEHNQLIETWISRAKQNAQLYSGIEGEGGCSYSTSHGDLADVVKILLNENVLHPLLMLANHPHVPLSNLQNLSWGHHFGFSRVEESALASYLFFNVVAAAGILENGKYRDLNSYSQLVSLVTDSMDYDGQQLPHRGFFRKRDADSTTEDVHEYLKTLFRLLYRYDMVLRECGRETRWEEEVVFWVRWLWGAKTETQQSEDTIDGVTVLHTTTRFV
jgi:hypothetical protein